MAGRGVSEVWGGRSCTEGLFQTDPEPRVHRLAPPGEEAGSWEGRGEAELGESGGEGVLVSHHPALF